MQILITIIAGVIFGLVAIPSATASLTENSPFLPPDFTPGGSSAPSQSNQPTSPVERLLDFKGWYEISGEKRFLVAPKRRTDGGWMRMGESRNEITLLDFDPAEERVRVSFQGNEGWLEIAKLDSNPSGATAAATSQPSDGSAAASRTAPTTRPASATPTRGRVSPVPQRRTVTSTGRTPGSISASQSARQPVPPRIAEGRAPQGPMAPPPTGLPPGDVPKGRPDSEPPRERPNVQNINIVRE